MLLGAVVMLPMISYAQGSYVKLGIGQSKYGSDDSVKSTGYFLAYGMQIDPSLDVEFGVIDFGRAKTDFTDADITGTVAWRTRSVYAAGIGNIAISPTVDLQGKLGVAINRSSELKLSTNLTNQDVPPGEGANTNLRALVGAGVKMQFSKEIAGAIEYTYFGNASHGARLSLFNAALIYSF